MRGDGTTEERRAWLEAWNRAGAAMEQLRWAELRRTSEADSVRIFNGFDGPFAPRLRASSGLVAQQRLFRKLHPRSPAR